MTLMRTGDVQVGMELTADVNDQNGRLLLRAGTVVSDRELRLFKMWGIAELDIAGPEDDSEGTPGAVLDPELAAMYEPIARELFRHADLEHPIVEQLLQECTLRLSRHGGLVDSNGT